MRNTIDPDLVEARIKEVEYIFRANKLTICVLTLENDFVLAETAGAVSPENFDPEIGKKIAYKRALDKLFMLEGYLLQERLHQSENEGTWTSNSTGTS